MTSLGIIGPGLIWEKTHRAIIDSMPEAFRVVAVAARSDRNQKRGREAYPSARIYADAQDLIEDPEVDAVVVLTPISLNAPLARAALKRGNHAIVEKPLARSPAEARGVVESAGERGGLLYVLEQHVHKSFLAAARKEIAAGSIGTPVSFERSVHVRIAADHDTTGGYGSTEWRAHPDFPFGNFFDGGIHEIALIHELFGAAEAIYGRGRSLREEYGAVDLLSMVIEYPNEVHGVFAHSASLGRQGDTFVIHGTDAALVCGDTELRRIDAATGEEQRIEFYHEDESVTMWREIAAVLGERAAGSGSSLGRYTPDKALADLALMEALEASLESGSRRAVGA
jgi:predicted dehydrogenase